MAGVVECTGEFGRQVARWMRGGHSVGRPPPGSIHKERRIVIEPLKEQVISIFQKSTQSLSPNKK